MELFGHDDAELARTRQLLGGYHPASSSQKLPQTVGAAGGWWSRLESSAVCAPLRTALVHAGLPEAQIRSILFRLVGAGVASLVLSAMARSPLPLLLLGIWGIAEWVRLRHRAFARAEAFERDYTALLLSLASGVRTGLDPLVALLRTRELFPERAEVAKEVAALSARIDSGENEEQAIGRFGATINHPDIQLFRAAFVLSRREGSSIAECLQRLARVTRQRQSFRRKVRGAVAMQKLSAFGIAACALIIAVSQVAANPVGVTKALAHPIGAKALYFGAGLVMAGLLWMLRMTRARM